MPYFDQKRIFVSDEMREQVYNIRKGIGKAERERRQRDK
jgi:hypothetical protein